MMWFIVMYGLSVFTALPEPLDPEVPDPELSIETVPETLWV